jgi:glutathionylspermidine synthase
LRSLQDDWGTELQRGIGLDQEGYFIDQLNDRIPVLWKIYDWTDLQNDMANDGTTEVLARQLEQGKVKILEPLWKQVLANKGAMALIWQQFQDSPYRQYLLETHLESNLETQLAATQLASGIHVKKPLLGQEGVGISIQAGDEDLARRDDLGYGGEGFVVQEYIELPQALGYHYVVGSWVVDGDAAGVIIRGDRSKITGRHCLIIPHIVSDYD